MGYYLGESLPKEIHFSRREIRDLLIATLVVSVAFAIALSGGGIGDTDWTIFPLAFLISLLAIGSGFILHEMGHKFLAIHYGGFAEFRAWMWGLIMALMFALLAGFVFAAPGAVYIAGNITEEQNGKISAMGPLVNIIFAAIFFPLVFIATGIFYSICFYIYYINAFLGVFNLLPLGPLDGAKIFRWSVPAFIGLFVAAVALLVPAFIPGIL
jgi:Zn-dependent protease